MAQQVPADPGRPAGRREWVGLAILALPTVLVALDLSVLFLALPRLSADLHAGATQQLWVMDIYGFLTAGFLVTMGTLGDRIGRRKLLMIGAAAFGVASVLAAYSVDIEMLIAARALLGVAGATLAPSSLALISSALLILLFGVAAQGVVGAVPPEKAGSAASMSQTSGDLGIALGIAAFGSIGAAVYRGQSGAGVPAGVPGPAAALDRDTLAGAVDTARHLPTDLSAPLLRTARAAFTSGLNTAALVGAVLMVGLVVLAFAGLGRLRPTGPAEEPATVEAAAKQTLHASG